jgi:hypothetical protein
VKYKGNFVTRQEFGKVEAQVKYDIYALRTSYGAQISQLKVRLDKLTHLVVVPSLDRLAALESQVRELQSWELFSKERDERLSALERFQGMLNKDGGDFEKRLAALESQVGKGYIAHRNAHEQFAKKTDERLSAVERRLDKNYRKAKK